MSNVHHHIPNELTLQDIRTSIIKLWNAMDSVGEGAAKKKMSISSKMTSVGVGTSSPTTGGGTAVTGNDLPVLWVPSTTGRDSIASGSRVDGMLCYVNEDHHIYQLQGGTDNSYWVDITAEKWYQYCGIETPPSLTDNGDGSIIVDGDGVYLMHSSKDETEFVVRRQLDGITQTLTDGVINYIYLDYNAGEPEIKWTTTRTDISDTMLVTASPIFTIFRYGTTLHYLSWDQAAIGLPEKILLRLINNDRFKAEPNGLALADSGSQHFMVSAGTVWYGVNRQTLDAIDSSTDTILQFSLSGSTWTGTVVTGYNNSQYQNGTSGLATLSDDHYTVNWIYRSVEDAKKVFILLGTVDYTKNNTEASLPPINVPPLVNAMGILVGRIIVEKGSTTPVVDPAFNPEFSYAFSDKVQAQLDAKAQLNTGLVTGGVITINADPTKFDVDETVCYFDDYTVPTQASGKFLTYGPVTGITVTNIATQNATYLGIDSSGALIQSGTPFTNSQRRSIVTIGAVIHSNRTTINTTNVIVSPDLNVLEQIHDLMLAIGPLNLSGNEYTPYDADLRVAKSAGTIFKMGSNFQNDPTDPHVLAQTANSPITNMRYRLQDGTEYADTTYIDPAYYDNAGVKTAVPNNKYTVQRIYMFQSGLTRIQYGQQVFEKLADAIASYKSSAFSEEANIKANGTLRAYLIVQQNATNLGDAEQAIFYSVEKFGGASSSSGGITYDILVSILGYTPEQPLTFSTGLTRNVNTVTSNISTGVAGGQTIYGGTLTTQGLTIRANAADLTGTVSVPGTTLSVSGSSGALTVSGGFGIAVTSTDTSGDVAAQWISSTVSPSGPSSTTFTGLKNMVETASNNTNITGYVIGAYLRSRVNVTSGGTVSNAYGFQGIVYLNGTGTLSTACGIQATVGNLTTGTITTGVGVNVSVTNTGGGTFTNMRGINIEDITGGTNCYSIYTGTGPVRLGDYASITTTRTDTSSDSYGFQTSLTINPASTSSALYQGNRIVVTASSSCAQNLTGVNSALNASMTNQSTGTVTCWRGVNVDVRQSAASGSMTSQHAFNVAAWGCFNAGSTLTTAYGLQIASPTATGTVTTAYGIKIENISTAGTNYSLYTGTGLVRFGGPLSFVDTMTGIITTSGSSSSTPFQLSHVSTNTGGSNRAFICVCNVAPSGASTAYSTGVEGRADLTGNASYIPSGQFRGITGEVRTNTGTAAGTMAYAYAGVFAVTNQNSAVTITDATCMFASSPTATGPITSSCGLKIGNQKVTGVTNGYGIYIDDQSAGGYAIYTNGGSVRFGGNTTISKTNCEFIMGDGTGYSNAFIRGASGSNRYLTFRTGVSSDRWTIGASPGAESGSDTGSSFVVQAYTDAGVGIDAPIVIYRAAGGLFTTTRPFKTTDTTTSTSYSTGSFIAGGGAGVGGSLYVKLGVYAGDGTSSGAVVLNGSSSSGKYIYLNTAGVKRWLLMAINGETGSDVGSDLYFGSYNDSGTLIDYPFNVTRVSGGTVTIGGSTTRQTDFTGHVNIASGKTLKVNGTQVVAARRTGWTAQTATASRADLGASPTVGALASFCRAMYDDLAAHGLVGA